LSAATTNRRYPLSVLKCAFSAAGAYRKIVFPESQAAQNFRTKTICWSYTSLGGLEIMRDPVLAGVLSLIVPGVGQLYNGRILAGILWLIVTPGFWIGTGGTLGWICHLIAAYTAYSYAKEYPVRV
jgi:TM2 domain-containing membrane protein YozV